jgi:hypothetical protein
MKTIRAYGCTRRAEDRSGGLSTAVCLVLDPAHTQHTMRVFRRDQRPGGVVHALADGEANRLLAQGASPAAILDETDARAATG